MRYVYFTKSLQALDVAALVRFLKEAGLDGADMAVRPGYPVTPDNAVAELPRAAKALRDEGLVIGLVSAPTDLTDPESAAARNIFDGCARAGVPAVKLGYFVYHGQFDVGLAAGRRALEGFGRLAARTGVRACYHTHSGPMYGNNCAGLRLLLHNLDPHHVGAFADTGHLAVNGGPIAMELDMVRRWLALVSIKDMAWERQAKGWHYRVVPAGEGIVHWGDVRSGLAACGFTGTISLHGEYEARDLAERQRLARQELAFLKKHLA